MPVAQGQLKRLAYKKQTGLGVAASGAGGQLLRRQTAAFNLKKDTFNSDEITTHQQYTGDTFGVSKTQGSVDNVLSVGTYAPFLGSTVRRDFAVVAAITAVSLTIAGAGPFTLTRAAGDFLAAGIKVGHVVRITAGTYTGIARDLNLLVTVVTATILTVVVPNGKVLAAQGPIATSTLSVIGKTTIAPTTGHTNDYYTFEEYYSDLVLSRLYTDVQVGSAEISIPATGNATIKLGFMGLGRTKGGAQVLTSPAAETTTSIQSSNNGYILLAGARLVTGTSLNLKIENGLAFGEAVIGSRVITDMVKGSIKASGTVTVVHDSETNSGYFDNETAVSLVAVLFVDNTDVSDFTAFVVPRAKLFSDDIDDGKKQLVASYAFTGEINASGGAALANDQTTIGMQDSQA